MRSGAHAAALIFPLHQLGLLRRLQCFSSGSVVLYTYGRAFFRRHSQTSQMSNQNLTIFNGSFASTTATGSDELLTAGFPTAVLITTPYTSFHIYTTQHRQSTLRSNPVMLLYFLLLLRGRARTDENENAGGMYGIQSLHWLIHREGYDCRKGGEYI